MRPGDVLREAWELYKAHWRHLLSVALVVYLAVSLIALALAAAFGWVGALLGGLVGLLGVFWLQGVLVEAVADIRDGRADLSIGETLRRVKPRILPIAGAGILATAGIIVGLVLLIVPGLVLLTWWLFLVPVIVLERRAVMDSFGRSREIVRGRGWNVFGLIVLTVLILIGFSILIGIALAWADEPWAGFIRGVVSNTLTAPFVALAWTLAYYRLARGEAAVPTAPA